MGYLFLLRSLPVGHMAGSFPRKFDKINSVKRKHVTHSFLEYKIIDFVLKIFMYNTSCVIKNNTTSANKCQKIRKGDFIIAKNKFQTKHENLNALCVSTTWHKHRTLESNASMFQSCSCSCSLRAWEAWCLCLCRSGVTRGSGLFCLKLIFFNSYGFAKRKPDFAIQHYTVFSQLF